MQASCFQVPDIRAFDKMTHVKGLNLTQHWSYCCSYPF